MSAHAVSYRPYYCPTCDAQYYQMRSVYEGRIQCPLPIDRACATRTCNRHRYRLAAESARPELVRLALCRGDYRR